MQQYLYQDQYKRKLRKLLILRSADGADYRVFCESAFLGTIKSETQENQTRWKTEYNILKPIAAKIGESITTQQLNQPVG